jgi:hypothetical protein
MISFDLKCAHGHVFEIWFRSSADYDAQHASGQIFCSACGAPAVEKAVMAPAVAAKGNRRTDARPTQVATTPTADALSPEAHALLAELAKAQARALEESQWVGDQFPERVRAMHYGETDHAPVHGTASFDEARQMMEEGLPVAPLIVPIVPPDQIN